MHPNLLAAYGAGKQMSEGDALKCAEWLIKVRGYQNGVSGDKDKLDGVPIENDLRQDVYNPLERAIRQWLEDNGFNQDGPELSMFMQRINLRLRFGE